MARSRDSEVWEAATVIALGCATLLALAYLLSIWKPLAPARRPRIVGGFFARHADDPPPAPAAPARAAPPGQASSKLPMVVAEARPAARAPAAASAPAAAPPGRPDPYQEAVAAGAPVDKAGLAKAGNVDIFHSLIKRVAAHPAVIKFLLNNKTLNDALFSSSLGKRRCNDAASFKDYLSRPDAKDPFSVAATSSAFDELLKTPASLSAVVESDFATRVVACPGIRALASDPIGLTQIAAANPKLPAYLLNPTVLQVIGGSPRTSDMLQQVQARLNGSVVNMLGGQQPQAAPR